MNYQSIKLPYLVALVLVTAVIALSVWQVHPTQPTILSYCIKYQGVHGESPCIETKRLSIPAAFGKTYVSTNWNKLELAYPSMRPWREVLWSERDRTHKIVLTLKGPSWNTIQHDFKVWVISTPPPIFTKIEPEFGLERYVRITHTDDEPTWNPSTLVMLPLETPAFITECVVAGSFRKSLDTSFFPDRRTCKTNIYPSWPQHIYVEHGAALVPEWNKLHTKVLAFTESLSM